MATKIETTVKATRVERRIAKLRRVADALWDLAHPAGVCRSGLCCDGDVHDAAHAVFRVLRTYEQPGWDAIGFTLPLYREV